MQRDPIDVVVELVPERQVQTVEPVEVGDADRGGLRAQDRPGLPSRDELAQEEDDQHHAEDHDDGLEEPTEQEAGHRTQSPPETTQQR